MIHLMSSSTRSATLLKDLSPEFKDFAKTVLTMFRGITELDRSFSRNKHSVSDNLHGESLMARRRVCEEINQSYGGDPWKF